MAVAFLLLGFDRTPTIIAAQAVTVVGAPLVAGVLFWLSSSKDVMGSYVASTPTKIFAAFGLVVLIAIAANTAINTLPNSIKKYMEEPSEEMTPAASGVPESRPVND